MATIEGALAGHEDFELGVPRTVPVTFTAEVPEGGAAEGLVFIIAGFGGDKDEALMNLTRRHIAAKHNLIAVSVRAHCHYCRPKQSETGHIVDLEIDMWSIAKAIGALVLQGDDLSGLTSAGRSASVRFLKSRAEHQFELNAQINPPGQDYQNFGVLAALDHLKVLDHLVDLDWEFDRSNVICVGTSHGAYIAHLIHKFAPNTISAIIDSSAYSEIMPTYIGFGGQEYRAVEGNITLVCSTRSAWQQNALGAPGYFDDDASLIRNVAYPSHLSTVSEASLGRKCQVRMIHSKADRLVPIGIKRQQAQTLHRFGYDVVLEEADETHIQNKFVTTLEHGMGISLQKLFDHFYPSLDLKPGASDRENETVLEFPGCRKIYRVSHGPSGITAALAGIEDLSASPARLSA